MLGVLALGRDLLDEQRDVLADNLPPSRRGDGTMHARGTAITDDQSPQTRVPSARVRVVRERCNVKPLRRDIRWRDCRRRRLASSR